MFTSICINNNTVIKKKTYGYCPLFISKLPAKMKYVASVSYVTAVPSTKCPRLQITIFQGIPVDKSGAGSVVSTCRLEI